MTRFAKPLLDRPAPHWTHDLPLPDSSGYDNSNLSKTLINYFDENYLEIPRATHRVRGVGIWLALFMGMFCVIYLFLDIEMNIKNRLDPMYFIPALLVAVVGFWGSIYMWRMDTEASRDEPIRFNRARQKVYVYRFHHDGLRPLSKKSWFIRAEVYDWEDLRAEACSIYGPMGSGGLNEAVFLAVIKPGTNKVVDRFLLAHGGREAEKYWTLARLYMQKGPEALPQFDRPPRDWNNEEIVFNLARYLAPKVEWPEDLDIESRTAPY